MANSVENVYSTAIFELCDEQGTLEDTYQELTEVSKILSDPSQAEFLELLSSPLISFEDKQKVLFEVFSGRLSDVTLDFLCVVTQKAG